MNARFLVSHRSESFFALSFRCIKCGDRFDTNFVIFISFMMNVRSMKGVVDWIRFTEGYCLGTSGTARSGSSGTKSTAAGK